MAVLKAHKFVCGYNAGHSTLSHTEVRGWGGGGGAKNVHPDNGGV